MNLPVAGPQNGRWFALVMGVSLLVIGLLAIAPLISALLASWIGSANGCVVNEGGVNPCIIWGADRGELLATLFVAGWFVFFTMPVGVMAFLVWIMVLAVGLLRRKRLARTGLKD